MASRAQEALTVEQLEALLDAIETRSPTGKRNLALLTLMADTGLRIGEALDLSTRDLVTEAGQIVGVKVRSGKGGKPANLAVGRRAAVRRQRLGRRRTAVRRADVRVSARPSARACRASLSEPVLRRGTRPGGLGQEEMSEGLTCPSLKDSSAAPGAS